MLDPPWVLQMACAQIEVTCWSETYNVLYDDVFWLNSGQSVKIFTDYLFCNTSRASELYIYESSIHMIKCIHLFKLYIAWKRIYFVFNFMHFYFLMWCFITKTMV